MQGDVFWHARLLRLSTLSTLCALCGAMACAACAGNSAPGQERPVMEQCQFKRSVAKGASFDFELARSGGTGYQWFVEIPADAGVRLLSEGDRPASGVNGVVGQEVRQWWKFEFDGKGKSAARIDFFLYRSWEGKEHAVKHCSVGIVPV